MADVRDIQMNFTANTSQAEAAIQRLKGSTDQAAGSLDKQAKSTVNANGAVVSFGRIIQDAPFGIIGVANNITMLSEQFVSLKAQAGSTGAALTAMKAAMVGPLGLTLAISAITTALQFWALQSNKTKKALDALGDSLKRVVEFKNPFENFVLKFDTANVDKAISQVKYELGVATTKVTSLTGSPNAEEMLDPSKLANRAGESFKTQKALLPRIEVLKKLLEYLTVIKKEIDVDSKVFKELGEFMKSGLDSESDKPFKFDKGGTDGADTKTKQIKERTEIIRPYLDSLREEINLTLEIDNLTGKKTSRLVYGNYLDLIAQEISSNKLSQSELLGLLKLRKEVLSEMGGDYPAGSYTRTDGFDYFGGFDKGTMKGMKSVEKENLKNKLKADQAAAKAQYAVYKDYFIDPFTDAFKGEFSKAWQSIFGEANSLLEKFIQSLSESLFNKAVGSAASGILGMIFPGFNLLEAAVGGFGGGGDRATVNQIVIDGELIATQKQATRIKAQLDRQASLR